MADLTETLAAMTREWNAYGYVSTTDAANLLTAVEGVLALCDKSESDPDEYVGGLSSADVRKALTDALGADS
jgi:hypothetical protein